MATPIPYISTSRPLPAVILVNVPFLLLRYSADRDLRPRGVQSLLLMSRMSGQPSPSASKNAPPDPSVSGRNFFPARPLLWVNLTPEAAVISGNFPSLTGGDTAATETTSVANSAQQQTVAHALVRAPRCRSLRASGYGSRRRRALPGFV